MIGALVAAGDVDELRLALQGMLQPSACGGARDDTATSDAEPLPTPAPAVPSGPSASTVADAAGGAAAAAEESAQLMHSCGLTLRTRMVMGGAAVWPAALALAGWLRAHPHAAAGAAVLELGAGAGAPGLVCASLGARLVLLTDGDEDLLPLMKHNAALNASGRTPAPGASASDREGRVQVACLDWRDVAQVRRANRTADGDGGGPVAEEEEKGCVAARETAAQYTLPPLCLPGAGGEGAFDLVLAADVLFGVGDIEPLVRAATALLRRPPPSAAGASDGAESAGRPLAARARAGASAAGACEGGRTACSLPVGEAGLGEEASLGMRGRGCEAGRGGGCEAGVGGWFAAGYFGNAGDGFSPPEPAPRVLLARSNYFEGLVPTLIAAFEGAGMRMAGDQGSADGEAAVLVFEWG